MIQFLQQNIKDLESLIDIVCDGVIEPKHHPRYPELVKKLNLYNQIGAAFVVEDKSGFDIQWAYLGKEKNLKESLRGSKVTPIDVRTRTMWDVSHYERLKTLRTLNDMSGLMQEIVKSYKQRDPEKKIIMVSAGISDNDVRKKPENLDIMNDLIWLFTDLGYAVLDTLPLDTLISEWFVVGKIESPQHLMYTLFYPFFRDKIIEEVYAESLWGKSVGATFEYAFSNEFNIPHYTLPENFHSLSLEDAHRQLKILQETKNLKKAS